MFTFYYLVKVMNAVLNISFFSGGRGLEYEYDINDLKYIINNIDIK